MQLCRKDYEAKVGLHTGSSGVSYTALRISDVGTLDFDKSNIELGAANPSNTNKTSASGINIHKAGLNDLTGLTSKKSPVSAGCSLIPISSWKSFIGIFNTDSQRDNVISVTMSRSLSQPSNSDVSRIIRMKFEYKFYIAEPDALRVVIPRLPKIF